MVSPPAAQVPLGPFLQAYTRFQTSLKTAFVLAVTWENGRTAFSCLPWWPNNGGGGGLVVKAGMSARFAHKFNIGGVNDLDILDVSVDIILNTSTFTCF